MFLWIGGLTLGGSILEFALSGKATLSPVDPPKVLVVEGMYRHVRNPMYVGVVTLLLGETMLVQSMAMLWYTLAVFVGFNVFIKAYEEPTLLRMFDEQFRLYKTNVPMWIPRRKAWQGVRDSADEDEGIP